MPNYTVPLEGGGEMHVNASNPQAAADNVRASGNTPSSSGNTTVNPNTVYSNSNSNTGGGNPPGTIPMVNTDQAQQAIANAQAQANQVYLNSKLNLDSDDLAFRKAQQAFNESVTQAGLTGLWQGQPTLAAQQYYANTFGTWGTPTPGQQTMAGQNQQFTQQQALASMYGQYYAPGQNPTAGMTTQAAQAQAYSQWLQAQQESRLQQAQQQSTAQNYLTMMAGLRGPADWAQYQKVLGSTPQGMTDLVRAAAGQYIPGGGATTGQQPQAVNLQNFVGGLTGAQPAASDVSGQAAMNTLVAPNQMAPQTWNNLTPSQQQMLLGTWESQGYSKADAQALFNQSLPKYATQSSGAGSMRLQ